MYISNAVKNDLSRTVFLTGLRDSIPFVVLFIIVYVSYGALCFSLGLTFGETIASSIFLYSTPLQLILAQNAGNGLLLLPVILVMNARFALMSATLSPYFRSVSLGQFALAATLIIPSVFTACYSRFKNNPAHSLAYLLGIGVPLYTAGSVATIIGYFLGARFDGSNLVDQTSFVLALLLAILAGKLWPHKYEVSGYWLGLFAAPSALILFQDFSLVITPFFIGGALVIIEQVARRGQS